jgi:hypothetical protein
MFKRIGCLIMAVATVCVLGQDSWAKDDVLRVAILPFETNIEKPSQALKDFMQKALDSRSKEESKEIALGDKITDLLTAKLSENPAIQLVERAKVDKAFEELALGKTGITDEAQAARIGHMLGAQVLLMGKAFPLDSDLFIVAKVVGVETSRVFAAKANGALTGNLAPLVDQLGNNINKVLLTRDADLIGKESVKKDVAGAIKKSLGAAKLPVVSVYVEERPVSQNSSDPSVETEIIYLLQKSGFDVIDEKNKPLSDWATAYLEDSTVRPPRDAKADVIVVGEAFSEFATRRGELISCKGRVELRAIDVKTGKVLAIDRKVGTAVDIAEHVAGKTALQNATQDVAETLIPEFVKKWNKK